MPHASLEGPLRCRQFLESFVPEVYREGETVIRFTDVFLSISGSKGLVLTVVVETGHSRRFFIEVHDRDEGLGIRLEPLTDPEKTPGVKRSLGLLAQLALRMDPSMRIVNHHLEGYLGDQ